MEWAKDDKQPDDVRIAAVAGFADVAETGTGETLLNLALSDGRMPVRQAALSEWARLATDQQATHLVTAYGQLPTALKARARSVLLSRKASARVLLDAVAGGRIPSKDFTPEELFAVTAHGDPDMNALVHKHWGNVRGATPEEKLAEVRRLNNDLRAARGDAKSGHALFTKHCAACHRLHGEGGTVGPELTHANRADRDYLLVSVIDPSAIIRKEYLAYTAETRDGRRVTGVITAQTPATVTLTNSKAEPVSLRRDEIESLRESPVSVMPEGLLTGLKPQELRDLFAYLQTPAPKP